MVHTAAFSLDATDRGPAILTLDGEFDRSEGPQFEQRMAEALDSGRTGVVVDLRGVSFLDPTMVLALVRGLRRAEKRNGLGSLHLVRPNPVVWRTFVLIGMSAIFPAFPTLRDALATFTPRS
jgi:anti-sigma B factor antagonist